MTLRGALASPRGLLLGITLLAALLQASRLPMRWNQISFAYAAYFGEYLWFVGEHGWHTALTTFVGIHPPAYSLLFAAMAAAGASPLAWHAVSGLLSVAAVPVLAATARKSWQGRADSAGLVLAAALLLAVSPHRTAYGLEVNNYPLLVFATCLQMLAFARFAAGAGERDGPAWRDHTVLWLGLSTALAAWTHGLALALPAAQLTTLLLLPEGRVLFARFATALGLAALLCVPLLPGLLTIASGDGINEGGGSAAAWQSRVEGLPGRYGSAAAGWAVASLAGLGVSRILDLPRGTRLVPLSWLAQVVVATAMIAALIALGVASPVQLPYYLAPLPPLMLLAAASLLPERLSKTSLDERGLLFRLVTPRRAALGVLALVLVVNTATLALDWHRAQAVRSQAAEDYPLVAEGIGHWQAGTTLALIQFPQYMDDDKDAIDPVYPLLPIAERVWFDDPGVDGQVPFDPFFGQPVRYADDRWLYTFTSVPTERLDALADKVLADGQTLIVAAYRCSFSEEETSKLQRWAQARGMLGTRTGDEAMWLRAKDAPAGDQP